MSYSFVKYKKKKHSLWSGNYVATIGSIGNLLRLLLAVSRGLAKFDYGSNGIF